MSIQRERRQRRPRRGASSIAYALLLGLVSVAAISTVEDVGTSIEDLFDGAADAVRSGHAPQGPGESGDPPAAAPVAADDTYTGTEDAPFGAATAALGVLANDSAAVAVASVNGQSANVGQSLTLGSGATLRVEADGTVTLDPAGQFEAITNDATESFTYTARNADGVESSAATVSFIIQPVNDPPTVIAGCSANPSPFAVRFNTAMAAVDLTGCFDDPEGDPLSVDVQSASGVSASGPLDALVISGGPSADASATLAIRAQDSSLATSAALTLTGTVVAPPLVLMDTADLTDDDVWEVAVYYNSGSDSAVVDSDTVALERVCSANCRFQGAAERLFGRFATRTNSLGYVPKAGDVIRVSVGLRAVSGGGLVGLNVTALGSCSQDERNVSFATSAGSVTTRTLDLTLTAASAACSTFHLQVRNNSTSTPATLDVSNPTITWVGATQ